MTKVRHKLKSRTPLNSLWSGRLARGASLSPHDINSFPAPAAFHGFRHGWREPSGWCTWISARYPERCTFVQYSGSMFAELQARHLLHDCSDRDFATKLHPGDALYCGFDPTAPALHLGNLQQILTLVRIARPQGLRVIALFGGATGLIGDPGGRSSERNLLSEEEVATNVELHQRCVQTIYGRLGVEATFVNNRDWFGKLSAIELLRDIGKHFSVNVMLQKDAIRSRLEGDGISYTEFSYQLIQAYDFLHLRRTMNCRLQLGGSDQWGNITAGLDLLRKHGIDDCCALSTSLIVDSAGRKIGKSTGGGLWLNRDQCSPYRFHQFFLNIGDEEVGGLLRRLTFLSLTEIDEILHSPKESRVAQRRLADEVTGIVHGAEAVTEAHRAAEVLFGGSMDQISDQALREIFAEVPSSTMPRQQVATQSVAELLVGSALVKSKGEARRLIEGGGAYVNGVRLELSMNVLPAPLIEGRDVVILRSGKKNYHLIHLT